MLDCPNSPFPFCGTGNTRSSGGRRTASSPLAVTEYPQSVSECRRAEPGGGGGQPRSTGAFLYRPTTQATPVGEAATQTGGTPDTEPPSAEAPRRVRLILASPPTSGG